MSRSKKKNNFGLIVGYKEKTRSKIKRMNNRSFRRNLKTGQYDDELSSNTFFKKKMDMAYEYDFIKIMLKDEKSARK